MLTEISIGDSEKNQRLDKFLLKYLNKAPKSYVYKMMRKNVIKLNKKKASGNEIIESGDIVQLYMPNEKIEDLREYKAIRATKISFSVVYEDDNILLVNKPSGQLSHPENAENRDTLSQQIMLYFSSDIKNGFTPSICNRLDRNTSGIIICGKNMVAAQQINGAIKNRLIKRFYYALVAKKITEPATLGGMLTKNGATNEVSIAKECEDGAQIVTHYKPLKSNDMYSLLEVELETGKSHQIRAHLASIGAPIVGDRKYGNVRVNSEFKRKYGIESQLLHAGRVVMHGFYDELNYINGLTFECQLPNKFDTIDKNLFLNIKNEV